MRAITAPVPGGPEALKLIEAPIPEPASGEVLIKVKAAGVNRPDLRQRAGGYPPPPGITDVLGLEVAGEVVATNTPAGEYQVGDPVCALLAGGGYAEYCTAPAAQVCPKPKRLSWVEAAAVPETYFTVWSNLFDRGRLAGGETVLVHGGASGIGTTAIQLAKVKGCRVITTVGTDAKARAIAELGAEVIVNYNTEDFVQRALEATDSRGVNVILDMVCGDYLTRNLACLAIDGRLVVLAFLGGGSAQVDIESMIRRRQSLTGTTLRPQTPEMKGRLAKELRHHVWPHLERHEVTPVIQEVVGFEDASQAHRLLEMGQHVGKYVLAFE